MSAKWNRSKRWDDEHIPGWAWPVKFVLRAFSSIPMAVVLLSCVVVYAAMASVPVGLVALGLTWLFYGATLAAMVGVVGVFPLWVVRRLWRPGSPGGAAARFAATVGGVVLLAALGAELWHILVWPRISYDPTTGGGVRFFAEFVERYKATTLRRLPGMEMSEPEFYSWWPLRLILLLFVLNMVMATVRRIEFVFPNLGVLSVHTGIVVIALGSVYYSSLKREGDTLLLAGEPGQDGRPGMGEPQPYFYDNQRVVLWVRQGFGGWEQRPIRAPRYNDYNLTAGAEHSALAELGRGPDGEDRGPLDRPVAGGGEKSRVPPDVHFRIVGYASYAEPVQDWVKAEPPGLGTGAAGGGVASGRNPLRFAHLIVAMPDGAREIPFYFLPGMPSERLAKLPGDGGEPPVFGIEYTRGMRQDRWADLGSALPDGAAHGLVVEVPGADGAGGYRGVFAAEPGQELRIGQTGYTVSVKEIWARPPFPIITEGYRGATSSVAVVRVTGPDGKSFERWVYHRYPEISQDMLEDLTEQGMPRRREADPAIRIGFVDASKLQVYVDEPGAGEDSPARAVVRVPGAGVKVIENIPPGGVVSLAPGLELKLGERWAHAEAMERPAPVPLTQRRNDAIGTHQKAMLGVEVSVDGTGAPGARAFRTVVWLPFTRYLDAAPVARMVPLPDGRSLTLAFGRQLHQLPGFVVQLADFQMIAYDHRGSPRDYQSLIRVVPLHSDGPPAFKPYTHVTKLNAPLQAPFMWSEGRGYLANVLGTLASRLNPNQYKFSQAGWDSDGWARTQREADQGLRPRPFVSFTILGVGNNPGIHIIAFGAILMSVGIPWAFYLKPVILRRRGARLAAQARTSGMAGAAPVAVGSAA
jgi:hypothetical protein